jgi:hypothetical protein
MSIVIVSICCLLATKLPLGVWGKALSVGAIKIGLVILGALATIIVATIFVLLVAFLIKRRIPDTDEKPKPTGGGFGWGWGIIVILLLSFVGFWWGYISCKPQRAAVAVAQENWQLCWEKKPEYAGETSIRYQSLPAKIESRTAAHIVISYSYSGGQGVMEGTSIDGIGYDGQWKDSTGWGKWHLRFISPDTAFGWSDDKGKGYKQPSVLERKRR